MCISFLLFSSGAYSSARLANVTITKLNINKGIGNLVFILASEPPVTSGCHTNKDWSMVLPLDTELDNKIYSALLAAYASNSKVQLDGSGQCSSHGIEYLNNFSIYK